MLTQRTIRACSVILVLLSGLHCNKKCQPPSAEVPKSITANVWRLISSTSPQTSKNLSKYTFPIMTFKTDFSGDLLRVEKNTQFEKPFSLFTYSLKTDSGREGSMTVVYFDPPPDSDKTEGTKKASDAPDPSNLKGIDYDYRLSKQLTLIERQTGYTYEFVPFVGVVDPDSTCSF